MVARVLLGWAMICGCGGASVVDRAEPLVVEPAAAWLALGVPLGDGRVTFSTDDFLTVVYDRGTVGGLASSWVNALTGDGWAVTHDSSSEAATSVALRRGERVVMVGVFDGIDGVTVTATSAEVAR